MFRWLSWVLGLKETIPLADNSSIIAILKLDCGCLCRGRGYFYFFHFFCWLSDDTKQRLNHCTSKNGGGGWNSQENHTCTNILFIYRMYSFIYLPPPAPCQYCVMNSHHGLRNPSPIPQVTHRSHSQLSVTRYMSFPYVLKQMKASCQHATYHFKSHLNNFDCPALILGWFACPYHAIGGSWRTRIIASQLLPVAPERSLW